MAQFNFGSNTSFGAKPNTTPFGAVQPASTGFGTQPASTGFGAQPASTGFGAQPAATGFGAQPASTGFGAQPATSGFGAQPASTGFGGQPAASTGFGGQPAQPGSITFGTPIASVAPNQSTGLSFGTPTLGTGLNFSATPKPTGLTFGTANTSFSGAPTFGTTTPAQQPTTGLTFGAAATTAGLSFGTPTQATFSLGATSTTPTLGTSFGATPTSNPNPLGGISFGTPTATTTTTAFNLGTNTPSFGATPLNFGLGTNTSTAPTPNLNFKLTIPAATSTTPATTSLFPGFTTPAKTTTLTLPPPTAASTTTSIGLGGVDATLKTGQIKTGTTQTVSGRQNALPNEILQTIESFKQQVKDQKTHSSDISRTSVKSFVKVREDTDLIMQILKDVGSELQKNQQLADKLKQDSAKCLHDAEIAQHTHDTPPGMQFENTAPLTYFIELANKFEQELQALRVQIDVTGKHFQSLHEPTVLRSQELALGMRRLHDTFVALAGRLHSVHTQVESQKEQYLNLRKYILKDPTNIFLKADAIDSLALDTAMKSLAASTSVCGPTPFSSFQSAFGAIQQAQLQQEQQVNKPPPSYPATTTSFGFGTNSPATGILGNTSTFNSSMPGLLFGSSPSTLGQTQLDSSGFQLQNPPPGNKRGKR